MGNYHSREKGILIRVPSAVVAFQLEKASACFNSGGKRKKRERMKKIRREKGKKKEEEGRKKREKGRPGGKGHRGKQGGRPAREEGRAGVLPRALPLVQLHLRVPPALRTLCGRI